MDVRFIILTAAFSVLFNRIGSIENKSRFVHKGFTSFKEELIITNVTSDENLELGHGIRKWKSMTLGDKNYAIGMNDTGICLLTSHGRNYTSLYVKITENAIKLLDVQLHKVWNETSHIFEPGVLVLLEGGSLSWFKTNQKLELHLLWTLELDKDAFLFDVYTIDKVDYLFALNRNTEKNVTTLEVYKASVSNSRYKYLWPEQTIQLEAPTTSFTLNNQGSDYYLSITQSSSHHVKIYKRVEKSFMLHWKIWDTDADTLRSFSIGPKTYLSTNGKNSSIYRITKYGPMKEELNEGNITNWLPIPLITYREEIYLLAQKEIDHDSHNSHSIELVHSTGFDFEVHHEIPCLYYNNSGHGLDCLVEEEDHHVELNMSAILPFENAIGLIILRNDLHSQLFILSLDVNVIPNPRETRIKHLMGFKEKLERMQKEIYEMESSHLQAAYKKNQQRTSKADNDDLKQKYESIKDTVENLREKVKNWKEGKEFKVRTLTVNGNVKVEGIGKIVDVETKTLNNQDTLGSINDIVQINIPKKIGGKKIIENSNIENIVFDTLNDIDKNKIVFNETPIILKGNVTLKEGVDVSENITTTSGKVNNINLEEEIVNPEKVHDSLLVDMLKISDNLEVANINSIPASESLSVYSNKAITDYFGSKTFENINLINVNVTNLNSRNFSEILQRIIMRNLNYTIPGSLEIDVLNASKANISYLNVLQFPDDYVVIDSNDPIQITGKKKFETNLTVNSLIVNGLINGINTSDIFTLSTDQNIGGSINFKNLEILEPFEEETYLLKSNDIIDELNVEGTVIIEENISEINVDNYLDNFLWRNADFHIINSTKIFNNLSISNLSVETINNIPIDSFLNKHANQTFLFDTLNGNVTIENLYVEGKINDVDVKDLVENSIELSLDQNITSFLTFEDLKVDNLEIFGTLNELLPNEFLHTNGNKYLTVESLKNINVDEVIVEGEVFGDVDGFNVEDFERRVLKNNGNQDISGVIRVDELYVDHLKIQKINGYYNRELFDADHYISLMERMISECKVGFKYLNIIGNLSLETINDIPIDDIINNLKFTKENTLQSDITFRDNVNFNGVNIRNFNGVPFKLLVDNLIFKNETKVNISSTKTFLEGFEVKRYIEAVNINGISPKNILRKENIQRIKGPIIINGNVTIEDDFEVGHINDVSLEEIKEAMNSSRNININHDVLFNHSANINSLILKGYFNGENLTEILHNAIGLNDDVFLKGHFTFNNKVYFNEDLDISDTFNDINLSETYRNIVFINENDFVEGLVSFAEHVAVTGTITVESDLLTKTIMGINPHDWWNKGVFISKGFISGNLTFENVTILNTITTKLINNMNASRFIPLTIDQTINENLIIENAKTDQLIQVDGFVNEVKLYSEFSNTVLNQGFQNVTSKIKFNGNVVVYNNLTITEKVNNLDFAKVVFTNKNQNLHGNYRFLSKSTTNNLEVYGLINGINFTDFNEHVLKKNSDQPQNLSEPIKIKNLVFEDYSYGPGLISGLNMRNIENDFIRDYKAACEDVNYLLHASKKQIFKFKYFEFLSTINFEESINLVYYFEHNNQHYILVNERDSCNSIILRWNYKEFDKVHTFLTGFLTQIITVKNEGSHIYFIGISSNCSVHKTNLWVLEENNIKGPEILDDVVLLQESAIPHTFYALTQNDVREYKITANSKVGIYRKWVVDLGDNVAFIPRGLKTGPALRDGQKIIKLERNGEIEIDFDYDVEEMLLGETTMEKNKILPGRNGEMIVLNVGKANRRMVAISSREGSTIKTKSDSVKIYSDVFKGTLFHKIPAYKPSSLTSLEFGNGETLLVFFEDQRVLQVYEYRGIEGFQQRKSAKIRGEQIIKMELPINYYQSQKILVILNNNELNFLEVVMDGNDSSKIQEVYCEL